MIFKAHGNQNGNAHFIFLFDYRVKKMSFCCLQTFLCRTVFEQQLVKVRDFERSANGHKFFFSIFQKLQFPVFIFKTNHFMTEKH